MQIKPIVINTACVSPRERFTLWRDALSSTHETRLPEHFDPTTFNASARGWNLGVSLLIETKSTAKQLVRTPRLIRADQVDHYIIRLQQHGRWVGELGNRTVSVAPGEVVILDMARPTAAHISDMQNINLLLPRDTLDAILPPFDVHGLVLRDGMANLVGGHLTALVANMRDVRRSNADQITDATCRLITACLSPSRDIMARAHAPLHELQLIQIRRYVARHLCTPNLSPQTICKALHLSRSTLYAACEPLGGIAAFIQRRRLERIHAILSDPRDQRRISEIAYQHGFVNEAHFSRTFRRAFGCSPRDVRNAPGVLRPAADYAGTKAQPNIYESWLRQLSR